MKEDIPCKRKPKNRGSSYTHIPSIIRLNRPEAKKWKQYIETSIYNN